VRRQFFFRSSSNTFRTWFENYRERYQDPPSCRLRTASAITQLIAHFRQKYGMTPDPRGRMANKWPAQTLDEQLALF